MIGVNLVFGMHDWGRSPSQRGIRATDGPDMLSSEGIVLFRECFPPGMTDDERRSPDISPAFAPRPSSRVSVGRFCRPPPRRHPRARLAMGGGGHEMELFVAPDMPHGFQAFPCGMTKAWERTMLEWFATRLAW